MLNRFISNRRTLFLLFFCSHIINVLAGTYTVTIGDGSSSSEVVPICNWHMNTYFGSQCFYSESQLSNAGLKRGDRIKSISFYCKSGGSSGGSFNVRIKNINSSSFSNIEDMSQVTIFSNKTLNPYAPGQWITFNSSSSTSQFTYNGKSIVVDIRNTSRGNQQAYCFFSATNYSHSSAAWFNSPSENVIGNYSFENYQPVIKITYESSNPPGPPFNIVLNKSNIWLDMGETEKLYGWRSTDNQIINDLLWKSSDNTVATVDEYGKVTARNIGSATITAYGRYGGYDISASCNVTVRYNHNTEYDFEQNGIRYRVKPNNYNEVIVTGSVHNSSTYSQLHLTIPPIVNNYGRFYTVTEIGSHAFNNKHILIQINLPNTLRCIGDYAFSGNPLSSLNFTTPLSSIGVGAFQNCILTDITIPESVTYIGENAFKGNRLNYVMCYIKEPLSINANTFDWVGLFINASLGVPDASIDKYRSKYPWSHFASIFSIGGGSTTVQATGISLNKSSTTLAVGATATLVATVTPSNATNKTVSWKSSDTSVATVDQNGKVTAKAVGTANITATTTDGSNLSATCKVTVTPASPQDPCPSALIFSALKESQSSSDIAVELMLVNSSLNLNGFNIEVERASGSESIRFKNFTASNYANVILQRWEGTTWIENEDGDMEEVEITDAVRKQNLSQMCDIKYNEKTRSDGKKVFVILEVLSSNDCRFFPALDAPAAVGRMNLDMSSCADGTYKIVAPATPAGCSFSYTGGPEGTRGWTADAPVEFSLMKVGDIVIAENTILATGISLNNSSTTLAVGATATLVATVTPSNATNKTVSWKSSDTSVATVDQNGKVTAKAVGTANITATTTDGSNLSATCKVTVTSGSTTVQATGISLNKSSLSLNVGDTETLVATVTPSNATNKTVSWKSSNTAVATVSYAGKVTAKAAGVANITATTTDGTNLSATCKVTVTPASPQDPCPSALMFSALKESQSSSDIAVELMLVNSSLNLNGFNIEVERASGSESIRFKNFTASNYANVILQRWEGTTWIENEDGDMEEVEITDAVRKQNLSQMCDIKYNEKTRSDGKKVFVILEVLSSNDCRFFPALDAPAAVGRMNLDMSSCADGTYKIVAPATPAGCSFSYTGGPEGTRGWTADAPVEFSLMKVGDNVYAPVLGICTVDVDRNLVTTKYYNLQGIESDIPFPGINIVVMTYSDGTKSAKKFLNKQ